MSSPVSRLPLTTAQIAVLQARPVPKAAPRKPVPAASTPIATRSPAAKQVPALAGAAPPPVQPSSVAAGPVARSPQRGSLVNIVA
jgi:hypothetical protein